MKILILCKRRPMQRDLLQDPYGRFYYLPKYLSESGINVTVALLSYKKSEDSVTEANGIKWHSVSALPNPLRYLHYIHTLGKEIKPDWIVGLSDTYYGILAQWLAKKIGARSLIDAYDNYESYIPWCKPLHFFWRRAISRADAATVAGPSLKALFQQSSRQKNIHIVPMSVDPDKIQPIDRVEARSRLNLPLDCPLIGYCGSICSSRGIDLLFQAFEQLKRNGHPVELVLTGFIQGDIHLPKQARFLGAVRSDMMSSVFSSLDILIAINRDSAFGNYSYPIKLYEAITCGTTVIATETQSTRWMLDNNPQYLVPPEDKEALIKRILNILENPKPFEFSNMQSWQSSAKYIKEHIFAKGKETIG